MNKEILKELQTLITRMQEQDSITDKLIDFQANGLGKTQVQIRVGTSDTWDLSLYASPGLAQRVLSELVEEQQYKYQGFFDRFTEITGMKVEDL